MLGCFSSVAALGEHIGVDARGGGHRTPSITGPAVAVIGFERARISTRWPCPDGPGVEQLGGPGDVEGGGVVDGELDDGHVREVGANTVDRLDLRHFRRVCTLR